MRKQDTSSNTPSDRDVQNSKLARVIAKYDLDGIGDALENQWTAEENRRSLRELADWFNQQVLQASMEAVGRNPLEGEVENIYRLLGDDASSGSKVQTRKRLERHGVDVDTVTDDFVSHQAVHTYLTKYRQASHTPKVETAPIERRLETIQRLQSRIAAVTETTIDQLEAAGEVETHNVDVFIDVRVLCRESGTQYALRDFLENGGCTGE